MPGIRMSKRHQFRLHCQHHKLTVRSESYSVSQIDALQSAFDVITTSSLSPANQLKMSNALLQTPELAACKSRAIQVLQEAKLEIEKIHGAFDILLESSVSEIDEHFKTLMQALHGNNIELDTCAPIYEEAFKHYQYSIDILFIIARMNTDHISPIVHTHIYLNALSQCDNCDGVKAVISVMRKYKITDFSENGVYDQSLSEIDQVERVDIVLARLSALGFNLEQQHDLFAYALYNLEAADSYFESIEWLLQHGMDINTYTAIYVSVIGQANSSNSLVSTFKILHANGAQVDQHAVLFDKLARVDKEREVTHKNY